jgi:hypothetical protein
MSTAGWAQTPNRTAVTFDAVGGSVAVGPLDERDLHRLQASSPSVASFAEVLAVYTDTDDNLPIPMLGTYEVNSKYLRFTPRFAWVPGIVYRAKFDYQLFINKYGGRQWDHSNVASSLDLSFDVPRPSSLPTTITKVTPSSDQLPENLLRAYIHFSAPMSLDAGYRYIHLLDESESEVTMPFLVLDHGLWDPAHQRFTVLFDPGRIKRGIKANLEQGPPLKTGRKYELVIDAAWPDATGRPLANSFRKVFKVGPADRRSPDYKKWRVLAPLRGTRSPVSLRLEKSLDAALLKRMIVVCDSSGERIEGTIETAGAETEWSFIPTRPWRPGRFEIRINPALEDLAGNNLVRVFDTDLDEVNPHKQHLKFVRLEFSVK